MFEDITYNELPQTREEALALVLEHNSGEADLAHYKESEVVMRFLAERLGQNVDYWGQLGLLHDLDWGMTKADTPTHCTKTPDMLRAAGYDEQFIQIILSHAYGSPCAGLEDMKRSKPIEYALAAGETVTGLVYAASKVREGGIETLALKSLKKKFKNKKFAGGLEREVIQECEHLGIPLDEFLQLAIDAITTIKDEIGI